MRWPHGFWWARRQLKAGKRVRRRAWKPQFSVGMPESWLSTRERRFFWLYRDYETIPGCSTIKPWCPYAADFWAWDYELAR